MDQIIKRVLDKCEMDVPHENFKKKSFYIYSAKTKTTLLVEDGKVVKLKREFKNL